MKQDQRNKRFIQKERKRSGFIIYIYIIKKMKQKKQENLGLFICTNDPIEC